MKRHDEGHARVGEEKRALARGQRLLEALELLVEILRFCVHGGGNLAEWGGRVESRPLPGRRGPTNPEATLHPLNPIIL